MARVVSSISGGDFADTDTHERVQLRGCFSDFIKDAFSERGPTSPELSL
jgi:hypothetical protein